MSTRRRNSTRARAETFAALGDETRLSLLIRLSTGENYSIAHLTEGTGLSRQAVTKHLRVLERVNIVHATHHGRERHFTLDPQPLIDLHNYLNTVSAQWDSALTRLKSFVEKPT